MLENNEVRLCEFSRVLKLDEIKDEKSNLTFTASKGECRALAIRCNLAQIANLNSTIGTKRIGKGIYEITGLIEAELNIGIPDTENYEEYILSDTFCEIFASQDGWEGLNHSDPNPEFYFELITEKTIDIGEVIAQNLCLALDAIVTQAGRLDDTAAASLSFDDQFEVEDSPFSILVEKKFNPK